MTRTDDPDADLLSAAIAGDRNAFAALLDRHYDRVHALAWQLTGARSDAEDVAQEVCCLLAERIAGFRGEARFSTWLTSIVVNACRDLRRRRRTFRGMTERLACVVGLARGPDGRDLVDAVWLQTAIGRLKPAFRETAVLVAGQQLTHAEAARVLGVAEATISWRMHKIRQQLGEGSEV